MPDLQAARGTPLTSRSSEPSAATPGRRRVVVRVLAVTAVLAYALDQATKAWAESALAGRGRVPVLGDLLGFVLVRNPGAAFSTGTRYTVVFTALAVVGTVVVLWLSRRVGTVLWAVCFGLLLAGIVGNLTDRLFRPPGAFRGHVVDFLALPNWPVFNVADVCLNVGVGVVVLQALRGVRLDGSRYADDQRAAGQAGDPAPDQAGETGP